MDPLEYFSRFLDIPEMIFNHFKGKDLMTISEVSPSYYNFIASSKVLMERIKIAFKDENMQHQEGFDLLQNSSRMYQSIEVRRYVGYKTFKGEDESNRRLGDYISNLELDFFRSKAHEWKNVLLGNVYFRKKLDMWRLLSSVESSVEKINILDNGVLSFEDPTSEVESFEPLKFPNLKKIKVYLMSKYSCIDTLARFLSNAVEDLALSDWSVETSKHIWTKVLKNFENLRSLLISSNMVNQLFEDESWKQFKFKLKSLTMLIICLPNTNFRNFLMSQSDHLEKLTTAVHVEDKETFDVIMKMPKLKSLGIIYFSVFSDDEIPTKISNSITDLRMQKCANAVSIKFLLESMPKVKRIQLDSIDEEIFKMLKSMNRKFEELRVLESQGVDRKEVEEIFENYSVQSPSITPFEFFTRIRGEVEK